MALDFDTLNNDLVLVLEDSQKKASKGVSDETVFINGVVDALDTYISTAEITFALHRNAGSAYTPVRSDFIVNFNQAKLTQYVNSLIKGLDDSQSSGDLKGLAKKIADETDVFVKTITVSLLNVTAGAGNRFGTFTDRPKIKLSKSIADGLPKALSKGVEGGDSRAYFSNMIAESLNIFIDGSFITLNAQVRTGGIIITGTIL